MSIFRVMIGLFCLCWFCAVTIAAQTSQRITITSSVPVSNGSQTDHAVIAKLPIGTIVTVLEQSKIRMRIDHKEYYWYRVALSDGREGWIFGASTVKFSAKDRNQIYLQIAGDWLNKSQDYIEPSKLPVFTEQLELIAFLDRVIPEVKQPIIAAKLELARLFVIGQALSVIPHTQLEQSPYQEFIKAHENEITYVDPAQQYYVLMEMFWKLTKKYRKLPIADELGWLSAGQIVPGETEGVFEYILASQMTTSGQYLALFPNGKHVDEAINYFDENFLHVINAGEGIRPFILPSSLEEEKSVKEMLTELRTSIIKTRSVKKAAILQDIAQVAKRISRERIRQQEENKKRAGETPALPDADARQLLH